MRPQPDGIDLAPPFVLNPSFQDVYGEYIPLYQELMIRFQGLQDLIQGSRDLFYLGRFLGLQLVEIKIQWIARVNPILNPIDPGHQDGCKCQVWVAGPIGASEFNARGLLTGEVNRNTDACTAVSLGIGQIDRCLIAGDEPLIGVCRGGTEGQQRWGVFEYPPMKYMQIWLIWAYPFGS
jgi:hypothetical protein